MAETGSNRDNLSPPYPSYVNPDCIIPLSPPIKPPFAHYNYSSPSLPATPYTPYPLDAKGTNIEAGMTGDLEVDAEGNRKPTLKPYLTLGPRLLLTAFCPALLPLILSVAHLIQTRSSTATLAATLKSSLLSACAGIAKGAGSLQALPRYLAMQTNDEVVRATQASVLAVGAALIDCITIIETVVTFIIDTYRSMLLCTLQLAVQGTLEILISAVETITSSVTGSLNSIRSEIQSDLATGNELIQKAVSALNTVTSLVDVNLSIPNITIPSLTFLENVTIPTSFEDTLISLNASMPSLTELKEKMDAIIDTPFEVLKADINSTRLEIAASFNSSILPVPSLTTLGATDSTSLQNALCGDLDTSVIDDTANALHKLASVAIGLMILVLVMAWGALAIWEWRRWRAMRAAVDAVELEWASNGPNDAWMVVTVVEHPMIEKYGKPLLHRVATTQRARNNLRWYLSFLAHPTCLTLLLISLFGLIALECQMAALQAIKLNVESNANATVTASTESLVAKLNVLSANASADYALDFNNAISNVQTQIDNDLFGAWVNTTAVTLNTTLVEFYDEIESLLNATFGGTILYNPINTFIYCILGSKITNLEEGLTWISQHAQVTLPTLPDDILQLSNASMTELVTPVTAAAVGTGSSGTGNDNDGVVGDLIAHFESALRVERNVYAILLGVWAVLAFAGLVVVLWHSGGRDCYLAWRMKRVARRDSDDNNHGINTATMFSIHNGRWPWSKDTPIYDNYRAEKGGSAVGRNSEGSPALVSRAPSSFLDYKRGSTSRLGHTLSALAAPGQAFLRMTGYNSDAGNGAAPLVRPGTSSEKYTRAMTPTAEEVTRRDAAAPTPPPFWINKVGGALAGLASYPARGVRLSLARNNNVFQSEQSFGASQPMTARPPHDARLSESETGISRDEEGRYPSFGVGVPRRLSRAPTPTRGQRAAVTGTKSYPTPESGTKDWFSTNQDEVDRLGDDNEEVVNDPHGHAYEYEYNDDDQEERIASVRSSIGGSSYGGSEPRVENARTGTAALAAIFANLNEERRRGGNGIMRSGFSSGTEIVDPFATPFDHANEKEGNKAARVRTRI